MFFFKGDHVRDVDVLVGCFSALRRKAIDQVGMLDENFYMYGDDLDWCRRLRQGRWRVVFYPGAQAIHYMGTSTTKRDPVWYSMLQQESVLRYWRKYHGRLQVAGIQVLIFARRAIRWTTGLLKLAVNPKNEEARIRMKESSACLRALMAGESGAAPSAPAKPALAAHE